MCLAWGYTLTSAKWQWGREGREAELSARFSDFPLELDPKLVPTSHPNTEAISAMGGKEQRMGRQKCRAFPHPFLGRKGSGRFPPRRYFAVCHRQVTQLS